MIIDKILDVWFNALNWAVDLIPVFNISMPAGLDGLGNWLSGIAYFLPLGTIAVCLGIMLIVSSLQGQLWIVNWLIKRIRGG